MQEYRHVEFAGTAAQAVLTLNALPDILAGKAEDKYGLVKTVQTRIAVALLKEIQLDFITKMRGGTGRDGIKWPPLQPATIAARRITQKEWRGAKLQGTPTKNNYERGLLTPEQNIAWKKKFAQVLSQARADLPEKAARAMAAKVAWAYVIKTFNAQTRIALFGGRTVDILRDTGKLLRTLSPGFYEDQLPEPVDGQIIILGPGQIIVGTSEKVWHHKGIPGRLPARSLWPLNDVIPDAWWEGINRAASTGIMEIAALLLERIRSAA